MDLIIKAREVTVNITVQGFLKVVSANEKEIRFYISGEDNIKEASEQPSPLNNNMALLLINISPTVRGIVIAKIKSYDF